MKIPIFYFPGAKSVKYIFIEKRYTTPRFAIPIGCDCHPTYVLQKYHIRKDSLPFDWLFTDPKKGLDYVRLNLNDKFSLFLSELIRNDQGVVVSNNYGFAEFPHEPDLIESEQTKQKIKRRIAKFLSLFASKDIMFIYCLPSVSFNNESEIDAFIASINDFLITIKPNDSLHIYQRYDDSLEEHKALNALLASKIPKHERLHFTSYIRYLNLGGGVWGDYKAYKTLFRNLNIDLIPRFPKIYLKGLVIT